MLASLPWPEANTSLVTEDQVEIGVQVNGKLRDTLALPRDADEDTAREAALALPGVIRYLEQLEEGHCREEQDHQCGYLDFSLPLAL